MLHVREKSLIPHNLRSFQVCRPTVRRAELCLVSNSPDHLTYKRPKEYIIQKRDGITFATLLRVALMHDPHRSDTPMYQFDCYTELSHDGESSPALLEWTASGEMVCTAAGRRRHFKRSHRSEAQLSVSRLLPMLETRAEFVSCARQREEQRKCERPVWDRSLRYLSQ